MSGPEGGDKAAAPEFGVETWRGSVRPAYIDEMGHMNIRYYLAMAGEALVGLAGALGMPRAFTSSSSATLRPRGHHIRYLHEARARMPLHMRSAVLEMGESDAHMLHVLYHSLTGAPAAAITSWVDHVAPGDMRPFPFAKATRRLAEGLMAQAPDFAQPRGLAGDFLLAPASLAEADRLGLAPTAAGALLPAEADVFGLMTPDHVLERVANSMAHMLDRAALTVEGLAPDLAGRLGGATVELRQVYRRWPRIGDRLALRSGLTEILPKGVRMTHWLLDPGTGQPWAETEMLVLNFDLQARKAVELPQAALDMLRTRVVGAA